jgi:hypothetical protein
VLIVLDGSCSVSVCLPTSRSRLGETAAAAAAAAGSSSAGWLLRPRSLSKIPIVPGDRRQAGKSRTVPKLAVALLSEAAGLCTWEGACWAC